MSESSSQWTAAIQREQAAPSPLSLNLSEIVKCADCKVSFQAGSIQTHQTVKMYLALRSLFPAPLMFSHVSLQFNHSAYDGLKFRCNGKLPEAKHVLQPNTPQVFTITFPAVLPDAHVLKCRAVSVRVGDLPFHLLLTWNSFGMVVSSRRFSGETSSAALSRVPWTHWNNHPKIKVTPLPSKVSLAVQQTGPGECVWCGVVWCVLWCVVCVLCVCACVCCVRCVCCVLCVSIICACVVCCVFILNLLCVGENVLSNSL